jgi:hypothetical protein
MHNFVKSSVYLQPSSNLFYQKFLNEGRLPLASLAAYPTPSRASRGRAGGQKFISPAPPFLFARLLMTCISSETY